MNWLHFIERTKRSINREKYSGQGGEDGVTGNESADSPKSGNSQGSYLGQQSPHGGNHNYSVSGNQSYLGSTGKEEFHDAIMSKSIGLTLNGGDR